MKRLKTAKLRLEAETVRYLSGNDLGKAHGGSMLPSDPAGRCPPPPPPPFTCSSGGGGYTIRCTETNTTDATAF